MIAIDYGKKRTGIAWSDPLKIVASPVGTFPSETVLKELAQMVGKEKVERFVLGMPTDLSGGETHATPLVRQFQTQLARQFPEIPIVLWDERFTSKMAVQAMIQAGVPKQKRRDKGLIDRTSAVIMLQEFLENHL